jgi:hypothetical protein
MQTMTASINATAQRAHAFAEFISSVFADAANVARASVRQAFRVT